MADEETTEGSTELTSGSSTQEGGDVTDESTLLSDGQESDDKGDETLLSDGDAESEDDGSVDEIEYTDFTLPEGMELDASLLENATPLFKELKLTQEQAQKFVDLQSQYVQRVQDDQIASFDKVKTDWATEVKTDKDLGGDNFKQSIADASAGFKALGIPGLFKLFNDYGIGNHIDMVRAGLKINQMTKEDSPGETGGNSFSETTREQRLYPNMVEK